MSSVDHPVAADPSQRDTLDSYRQVNNPHDRRTPIPASMYRVRVYNQSLHDQRCQLDGL